MKRRYVVVRGARSICGMHPGVPWKECASCARAAAVTAAELATVTPKRPKVDRQGCSEGLPWKTTMRESPKSADLRRAQHYHSPRGERA